MYKRVHAKRAYNKGKKILLLFVILLLTTSIGYSAFQRTITVNMTATSKIDVRYQVYCELSDTDTYGSIVGADFNLDKSYDNEFCDASGDLNDPNVTFYTELYGSNNTSAKQYAIIVKNIGDGDIMLPIKAEYNSPTSIRSSESMVGAVYVDSGEAQIVEYDKDPDVYNKDASYFIEVQHAIPILINNSSNQIVPISTYSDVYTDSTGQKYFIIQAGETLYLSMYAAWIDDTFYFSSETAAEFGVSEMDGIASPDYAAVIEEHYDLKIKSVD